MSYEDLLRNYTTHAAQALRPIIRETAGELGIENRQPAVEILREGLARAYMAGADAGQSEVLEQAAEQGVGVNVDQQRPPR